MNTVILSLCVTFGIAAVALFFLNKRLKPKRIFLGYEPGREGLQPYPINSKAGMISVPTGKGNRVDFPVTPGFRMDRLDGKGSFWLGNLATGQLMKLLPEGEHLFVDGIHLALARVDGREKRLTASVSGTQDMLIKVLICLSVITVLLLVGFIWKFVQG
jgi:hypothetical protein